MAGFGLLIFAAIGVWVGKFTPDAFLMLAGPAGYLIGWPQRRPATTVQADGAVVQIAGTVESKAL